MLFDSSNHKMPLLRIHKMYLMKAPIFALGLFMALTSCLFNFPSEKPGEFKQSKESFSFVQEYAASSTASQTLTLLTSGGNIDVQGYDGDKVIVRFIVRKNNGQVVDMTLEKLATYADVEIISHKSDLSIRVKEIFRRNLSVGFEVKTPKNTITRLSTSGGNIGIVSLTGNQDISTSGGNLDVTDITGNLDASTSGGNISLGNLKGKMDVSTSGGNIHGENLMGDLDASTSGGNIHLRDVQGLSNVSTSGGNISLEAVSGSMKAHTSGGHISARMKMLKDLLELETQGGSIDCKLPKGLGLDLNLSADHIDTPLEHFQGTSKKEHISGQINGGGIPVTLSSSGGSISLEYE
jgi:hypothetical protein